MSNQEDSPRRHKPWREWSAGAKAAVISAGVVLVPGLIALFTAITMWLWNWLMPAIFRLPTIGFWQAIGILILAQILFKGSHSYRRGRNAYKKRQVWKHMQDEEPKTV